MPYLVRHAHAGNKHQWPGPDRDRPLSPTGQREAHGLVARLRGSPVTRILTSPAVRCQQTVAPLAEQRALPVELTDALGVDAPAAAVLALLTDPALATAVLCSHGETIGVAFDQLVGGGLAVPGALRREKGSTWVLDSDDGAITQARYLPPLRPRNHPTRPRERA
jgi:broad specificity phosphatase PhoE